LKVDGPGGAGGIPGLPKPWAMAELFFRPTSLVFGTESLYSS